jgi:hypothetical protein
VAAAIKKLQAQPLSVEDTRAADRKAELETAKQEALGIPATSEVPITVFPVLQQRIEHRLLRMWPEELRQSAHRDRPGRCVASAQTS